MQYRQSERGESALQLQTRSDSVPQVISDYRLHSRQDENQNAHPITSGYRIENEICNHEVIILRSESVA